MFSRRPFPLLFLLVAGLITWVGCQTAQKQETAGFGATPPNGPTSVGLDSDFLSEGINGAAPADSAEDRGLSKTPPGSEEDLEEDDSIADIDDAEFCRDNIYAQYLRDEYFKANKKAARPEKAFKPSRRSRRHKTPTRSPYDARDVEALFYARSRLVGESVPYFGAIPVVTNPRVEHWVRYFKNSGRRAFLRWLVRGQSVRNVVLP
ncbi:MAG: hypothetical protein NTV34_15935, partial [Proteobacteria bacterium]|nr:hypothetical protein [Pseudomonadota bacterium]